MQDEKTILNDNQITNLVYSEGMISPFVERNVRKSEGLANDTKKILSYGLSSFGYDVRLDREVKVFHNLSAGIIDPKRFDPEKTLQDMPVQQDSDDSEFVILPPNSYLLGRTVEYFKIPRDVMIVCLGKSTYARCGVIINVTPIEAGFEGRVVIEIANSTPLPVKIYINEGISQFLFFKGTACDVSYADRNGKYQGQTGVQLPLV